MSPFSSPPLGISFLDHFMNQAHANSRTLTMTSFPDPSNNYDQESLDIDIRLDRCNALLETALAEAIAAVQLPKKLPAALTRHVEASERMRTPSVRVSEVVTQAELTKTQVTQERIAQLTEVREASAVPLPPSRNDLVVRARGPETRADAKDEGVAPGMYSSVLGLMGLEADQMM